MSECADNLDLLFVLFLLVSLHYQKCFETNMADWADDIILQIKLYNVIKTMALMIKVLSLE